MTASAGFGTESAGGAAAVYSTVPVGVARISAQRDVSAPASRASCGAATAAAAVCRRAAGRGAPGGALGAAVAAVAAMCGRACCREAAAGGPADSINVSKPSTKLPAGDASSMAGSRGEEACQLHACVCVRARVRLCARVLCACTRARSLTRA